MTRAPASRSRLLMALAFAAWTVACDAPGPRAVVLNEDQCGFCRMEVTDARFAAEAITRTGRITVFDSVECLAGYVRGTDPATLHALWVTDADHPGTFVKADDAGFLIESSLRGPMGRTVAFASPEAARAAQDTYGGSVASWREVLVDTASVHAGAH